MCIALYEEMGRKNSISKLVQESNDVLGEREAKTSRMVWYPVGSVSVCPMKGFFLLLLTGF